MIYESIIPLQDLSPTLVGLALLPTHQHPCQQTANGSDDAQRSPQSNVISTNTIVIVRHGQLDVNDGNRKCEDEAYEVAQGNDPPPLEHTLW